MKYNWLRKNRFLLLPLLFLTAGLKGFIEVTDDYYENDLGGMDDQAFDLVFELRSTALTVFFKIITHLGDNITYFLVIAVALIVFWKKNLFSSLIHLATVIIFTAIISYVLKEIIQRPRPLHDHFITVRTLSFPSGHAMTAAAFYVFVTVIAWKIESRPRVMIALLSFMMIILIGFSRVYLGVHYFSDVLAGYAAGLFISGIALLIYEITERIIKAHEKKPGNIPGPLL